MSFNECMDFVLEWEGGYSVDADDPGGETKFGISKRAHPLEDITNLTRERALAIYHAEYWERISGDTLPTPVALACMDFAVHSGVARANRSRVDNLSTDHYQWSRHICYDRIDHLLKLARKPALRKYLRGWLRRVAALLRVIDA